jgi:hypothetical protein
MAISAARREDDNIVEIDLSGEARDTALWLADRYGVSPGDVVARALGLLWFMVSEAADGRRIVSEDQYGGDRRLIPTNIRTGDADPSDDRGR